MHGPMLAVRAVAGNVAHSGSGAVPKSTLERCWWRGSSWWHQCRCKHQGPEQRWPVTPKHHRHEQIRSAPSVDVEMRRNIVNCFPYELFTIQRCFINKKRIQTYFKNVKTCYLFKNKTKVNFLSVLSRTHMSENSFTLKPSRIRMKSLA